MNTRTSIERTFANIRATYEAAKTEDWEVGDTHWDKWTKRIAEQLDLLGQDLNEDEAGLDRHLTIVNEAVSEAWLGLTRARDAIAELENATAGLTNYRNGGG